MARYNLPPTRLPDEENLMRIRTEMPFLWEAACVDKGKAEFCTVTLTITITLIQDVLTLGWSLFGDAWEVSLLGVGVAVELAPDLGKSAQLMKINTLELALKRLQNRGGEREGARPS